MTSIEPGKKLTSFISAAERERARADRLHLRRALVASDDPSAEGIVRALGNRGLVVTEARSLKDALVAAATLPPRFVLVDAGRSDLRGEQSVTRMLHLAPDARIVLVMESCSIAATVLAMKKGVYSVLERPVTPARVVEELLRQGPPRLDFVPPADCTLDRALWEHAHRVLVDAGGNVSETARRLNVDRRTLLRILAWSPQ